MMDENNNVSSSHIIYPNGTHFWYKDGKIHREDGPAYISKSGNQAWYKDGKVHREDGPAYIDSDGSQYWYINNKDITDDITNWAKDRNIDLNNLSDDDKMVLKIEIRMWK
jgi:hypothetical protein